MLALKEKYGEEIGSGYCSDKKTQKFLLNHLKKYNDEGIFRKSWITWRKACGDLSQKKLSEF